MNLKPTLKNLKKVVRKPVEPEPYAKYIVRPLSIYFTWIFVRTPISANQVTILQEILGVIGIILLATKSLAWALIGMLLIQLGYILDCTDGEVARWKGQSSINGVFLDLIGHTLVIPGYMFALGFGVWMRTGQLEAVIFGFLSAIFVQRLERDTMLSVVDSTLKKNESSLADLKDQIAAELPPEAANIDMGSAGQIGRRSWLQVLFRYPDSMNVITLVVFIEFLMNTYHYDIGGYTLTYLLTVCYGVVLSLGRLWQIRTAFNRQVTVHRLREIINTVEGAQHSD
jgi:hypothetical protein